jgi:ATP/maltotriose-dependent transcriptional regulator MalT
MSSHPRLRGIDEVVLPLLARQLESCDPFVLVLDDVELVTHPGSLAIISCLVDHVPARSQLVLAARGEPEIPLARLRAAGDVLDLGAADLALDPCETRELLSTGGITMSQDQVREVQERAEGWAAGIALAMFPRAGHDEAGDLPAIGRSPDVAAYLLEEAVQRQPPDVRHFLLASYVLRRMSPALCDAALEIADSARLLAELERTSLFVIPLNGDGEWYRFHHLFRELLQAEQRRQEPDVVDAVLGRAAAWHERHGDPGEAFEYAHACGDLARAGGIVRRHGNAYVGRGEIETPRAWLGRCSSEQIASDPQLALAGAWIALFSGEAAEAWHFAAVAETASDLDVPSPDGATSLRSALAHLRATLATDGISQMLRDAKFVAASEQPAGTRWVMDGWRQVATAHLLSGRLEEAIAAFAQVLQRTKGRPEFGFLTVHCLGYSALAASDAGDWLRARKWARDARALTAESGLERIPQSVAPYLADRRYSPRTVWAYAFDLLAFVRWLQAEGVALEDVTTEVLLRFLAFCRQAKLQGQPGGNVHSIRDARSTGYAAATINRRLVAIAGLFEYRAMREPEAVNPVPRGSERRRVTRAERGGLLGHLARPKPSSRLRVREPKRLPRGLAAEEVKTLLESFRSFRDRAIAGLMLYSGLRSAEVLALGVQDVDVARGWVLVCGKGGRERRVPVDREVAGLIQI